MGTSQKLFGTFAARYDLHTPPDQYQLEHAFVLDELRRFGPGARVLDLGCGTGMLLRRARDAGFEVFGIDASPEMVAVAEQRLGPGVVRVQRLQDVDELEAYDAILSLSWPLHYCANLSEVRDSLARFHRALRPGGLLLLQVAHASNATGRLMEYWEAGPGGERDIQFLCRFTAGLDGGNPILRAEYVYSCRSLHELFYEEHLLAIADANQIAALIQEIGFSEVRIYDNHQREPLARCIAPFVLGTR